VSGPGSEFEKAPTAIAADPLQESGSFCELPRRLGASAPLSIVSFSVISGAQRRDDV
jgi:hypothetical protein